MNTEKLILLCEKIAKDTKDDAANFDGQPFTGKTMAEYMAYHGAAIASLADVIKELLQSLITASAPTIKAEDEGQKQRDLEYIAEAMEIRGDFYKAKMEELQSQLIQSELWNSKLAAKIEESLNYKIQVNPDITLRQQLIGLTALLNEFKNRNK